MSSLAGYYISRFAFRGRDAFLQGLLVAHAFPAMTLIIPIFLMLYWIGLLDTIFGVMLVLAAIELPFYVFVMKGFFDAVPWDIEMSAMTDGATRRQAFRLVVLPQVSVGLIAVSVFAFIRAWEEYIFVRTMLIENKNWVMSLYLFWVADDVMGVDYGIVAAVSVFYVLPSLLLYVFCQTLPDADDHRRHQGLGDGARSNSRICARMGWRRSRSTASTSSIEDGAFVAVLGPSGCGKSTTLADARRHLRSRAPATSCSTAPASTRSRRATATSASSSSPMPSTRT